MLKKLFCAVALLSVSGLANANNTYKCNINQLSFTNYGSSSKGVQLQLFKSFRFDGTNWKWSSPEMDNKYEFPVCYKSANVHIECIMNEKNSNNQMIIKSTEGWPDVILSGTEAQFTTAANSTGLGTIEGVCIGVDSAINNN